MPDADRAARDATATWARPARSPGGARAGAGGRGQDLAAVNNVGEALDDVVVRPQRRRDDRDRELGRGRRERDPGCPGHHPGPAHHRRVPGAGELRAGGAARHDARRRAGRQRASGRLRAVPPLARRARCPSTGTSRRRRTSPAAAQLLDDDPVADAAIAPPGITDAPRPRGAGREHRRQPERRHPLRAGQPHRRALPPRTGADKTSIIVELPDDQRRRACSRCSSSSPPAAST